MSQVSETNNVNPEKLEAFVGKVVGDFAASLSSTLAYIGQRLGLYKALACGGPALGAVATEEQLRGVAEAGGFKTFRRATQTPFNRVFEARR